MVECDVRGLSYVQAADKLHLSLEVIKHRKRQAYAKIADEIERSKEERRG